MHRHIWRVVDKDILPSAWEQMDNGSPVELKGGVLKLYEKQVIVTYQCEVCESEKVVRV